MCRRLIMNGWSPFRVLLGVFACSLVSLGLFAATVIEEDIDSDKSGMRVLGLQRVPCEIIGAISKTGVQHTLNLQLEGMGMAQAAIYTHSGTGAVFTAFTRLGQEEGPVLSSTRKDLNFSAGVVILTVSATKATAGGKYSVRIGNFGDFKVSFNANGGRASETTRTYTPGQKYGTLPTATRDKYDFTGWATALTNGVQVSKNTPVCVGYTNLVAQWKRNPLYPGGDDDPVITNITPVVTNYCVRFNANGGYGNMATQLFTWGEAKALSTNLFARTNFTFRGWATSSAGEVRYGDCQIVSNLTPTVGGTFDLYASWMPSADQFHSATVGGVTWSYTGTNGTATIQGLSSSGDGFAAAINPSFRGNLVIPESLDGNTVAEIGERAFLGCTGITNVVIPLTVEAIGSEAFSGCSGIQTGMTIPESVTSLGSSVFSGCKSMKIVRYYGDCPEADEALYEGAPASLVSGVLKVRAQSWGSEETIETGGGEGEVEPAEPDDETDNNAVNDSTTTIWVLPERWPSGEHGRRIYWLNDVKLYTVALDCFGGSLDEDASPFLFYLPGRRLGELPEPTYVLGENTELVFLGWYTEQRGGTRVDEDWIVSGNMKLYAHWAVSSAEVSGWQETLCEESEDFNAGAARVYQGYLYDELGTNEACVVGTVTLKVGKGRYDAANEETNAVATATVTMLGRKKLTLRGTIDSSGEGELASKTTEDELSVALTADGLQGTFGDYALSGARDRAASSERIDKLAVSSALSRWGGAWTVVLHVTDATGDGVAYAENGYLVFSAVVGTKGKTKVTGMLPDGTQVSVSGTMIFGDGCACVPVTMPLYAGRTGGLAFLLWFCTDEDAPLQAWGVSDWNAERSRTPFTASLEAIGAGRMSGLTGDGVFSLAEEFNFDGLDVEEELLPVDVPIGVIGARWSMPRADSVKFMREDGAWEITRDNGNPAGLALSYLVKNGTFKGTFKVYGVTEDGKSRKLSAKVFGGMMDGIGYGSAFIKGVGSVPVTIEGTQDN